MVVAVTEILPESHNDTKLENILVTEVTISLFAEGKHKHIPRM